MRITLRTSGGRGEYELAGKQGEIHVSDLFNKKLFYEVTPQLILAGHSQALRVQGKPRIRLENKTIHSHLYLLLAGILLLPKPKREFDETGGSTLLIADAYSMRDIKVDIANVQPGRVLLRPTDLVLGNADNVSSHVVFATRMARITRLWEHAAGREDVLSKLIIAHRDIVTGNDPQHKDVKASATSIAKELSTDGDILALAESRLGIFDQEIVNAEVREASTPLDLGDEDQTSQSEARVKQIVQWRLVASRGSDGARFRGQVRSRYDDRCLFSGDRLPKLEVTPNAGVDAAHILPWSTHGINSVNNGLCLNKLCHWAFDAGLLRMSFDAQEKSYVLDIPQNYRQAASSAGFSLRYFEALTGAIPRDRLPENQSQWPSPKYLAELNNFVYGA